MRFWLGMLLASATGAAAWEFTPSPVCTLWHQLPDAEVRITFDPTQPQPYSIAVKLASGWPDAPDFSIQYVGPRGLTITTDRHEITDGGKTLTVSDRGFGNVLNGLEFNEIATARSGETVAQIPLTGAAPKVQAFRACSEAPTA